MYYNLIMENIKIWQFIVIAAPAFIAGVIVGAEYAMRETRREMIIRKSKEIVKSPPLTFTDVEISKAIFNGFLNDKVYGGKDEDRV